MKPDINGSDGEYKITSLYFDDIYLSAYNDKLLGLSHRRKFRIRIYNDSPDRILLECKYKERELTMKKSSLITLEEYEKIRNGDISFLEEERFHDSAADEFFISSSMVKLSPAANVVYDREAYVCAAGNVRITFDKKLRASLTSDVFRASADDCVSAAPDDGAIILEVKYDSFIPSYIEQLLGGMSIIPESVSKYIYCTDKILEVKKCIF